MIDPITDFRRYRIGVACLARELPPIVSSYAWIPTLSDRTRLIEWLSKKGAEAPPVTEEKKARLWIEKVLTYNAVKDRRLEFDLSSALLRNRTIGPTVAPQFQDFVEPLRVDKTIRLDAVRRTHCLFRPDIFSESDNRTAIDVFENTVNDNAVVEFVVERLAPRNDLYVLVSELVAEQGYTVDQILIHCREMYELRNMMMRR